MFTKAKTVLIAMLLVGATSSAMAAPKAHGTARHHAAHARVLPAPGFFGFQPYAYGNAYNYAPPAFGAPPFSSAQERWFDQAKGDIF